MDKWLGLFLLGALIFGSALGVIYSKHRSRTLFVEIQQQQRLLDELDFEWGRLQLEQGTWGDHGRIERLARERLQMRVPVLSQVEMIKP